MHPDRRQPRLFVAAIWITAVVLSFFWPAASFAAGEAFADGYVPSLTPELKTRLAEADVAAGARFFERKCSQCHDGEKNGGHGKGPHLWNVMGRQAASVPGFIFSAAMKKVGRAWDYAALDYYLADTDRAVPGRAMEFTGIPDARLRAAVISYLRTLGDAPAPLP